MKAFIRLFFKRKSKNLQNLLEIEEEKIQKVKMIIDFLHKHQYKLHKWSFNILKNIRVNVKSFLIQLTTFFKQLNYKREKISNCKNLKTN